MTTRMLGAIRNPFTNVLGHCTGRMVMGNRGTRPSSEFDAKAVFEACAEHDVAVEINSRPERRDPPTRLIELARDLGCRFSIDSDSHAPGQLDFLDYGCERAEAAGIERRPDRQHLAPRAAAGLGRTWRVSPRRCPARLASAVASVARMRPTHVEVRRSRAAGARSRPTARATGS